MSHVQIGTLEVLDILLLGHVIRSSSREGPGEKPTGSHPPVMSVVYKEMEAACMERDAEPSPESQIFHIIVPYL